MNSIDFEKIKNIVFSVTALVIGVCTIVITYHTVKTLKSVRCSLSTVTNKVDDIANAYKPDANSWFGWAIKQGKPN